MTIAVDWDVKHQFKQTNTKMSRDGNDHMFIAVYNFFNAVVCYFFRITCNQAFTDIHFECFNALYRLW